MNKMLKYQKEIQFIKINLSININTQVLTRSEQKDVSY